MLKVKFIFSQKFEGDKETVEKKATEIIKDLKLKNSEMDDLSFVFCIDEKTKIATYDFSYIKEILQNKKEKKINWNANDRDYKVNAKSSRNVLFFENNKCVCCGIEGKVMSLEIHKDTTTPHFNLYSEKDDKLILMTKDHIMAKSCGGGENYSNFQVMCCECNSLKGHHPITLDSLREIKKFMEENSQTLAKSVLQKKLFDLYNLHKKDFNFNHSEKSSGKFHLKRDVNVWRKKNSNLYGLDFCLPPINLEDFKVGTIPKHTQMNPIVEINEFTAFEIPGSSEYLFMRI